MIDHRFADGVGKPAVRRFVQRLAGKKQVPQ
jgi:hypothetical protein